MVRVRLLAHMLSPLLVVIMVVGCGRGGSAKLPPAGFKVEFTGHNLPREMTVGQQLLADVSFKNVSARIWPSTPNHRGLNAVNLSYHWLDKKGRPVVYDGLRTSLPHDLKPGEAVQLNATIQAPAQSGLYMLEVTLVQEGVAWFSAEEGGKITVPVKVSEAKAVESDVNHGQRAAEAGSARSQNDKAPHSDQANTSVRAKDLPQAAPAEKKQTKPERAQSKISRDQRAQPWSVQIGSYSNAKEAEALARGLKNKGYDARLAVVKIQGKSWYRVRVGHLASRGEAEKLQKTLIKTEGFKQALVTNR